MQTFDVVVEQIIKRTRTIRVEADGLDHAEEVAARHAEDTPWPSHGIAILKQTLTASQVEKPRSIRS
jgi:hypothetical protein